MSRPNGTPRTGAGVRLALASLLATVPAVATAHNGSLQAPLVGTPPAIDGTIEQPLWGPDRLGAAAACQFQHLFALRTATNFFVAVDVPDTSAQALDALVIFFDGNHNGTANTDTSDRAVHLANFPAASNATPTTANLYSGLAGGGWGAPVALPAADVKYTRTGNGTPNGRVTIELRMPAFATTPTGFALVYGSETPTDCNGDSIADPQNFKWPPSLPMPAPPLPGLANPSQWGDIGRNAPVVGFASPTCCASADINYTQNGATNPLPLTAGVPVNITARVHNGDAATAARNVIVRVQVHNFGSGGGVVFTTGPSPAPVLDPVIASIGTSTNASTSPVTWPSPPAGLHGCIRAELQAPPATSLDDYAIGTNALAQRNIDVACVPSGGKKILPFMIANPDGIDQQIRLVKVERIPAAMKGLTLALAQPARALRPGEELTLNLTLVAPQGLPVTDVPRQTVHVPPTAGGGEQGPDAAAGNGPVRLAVRPGDRLHLMASGDVDIDGDGPIPGTGPGGRDVSREIPEGAFLLSGGAASQVGGALIGSFTRFETSFAVGSEASFTVPDGVDVLLLAVNDLRGRHADNTGKGFDVEAWTTQAGAPLEAAPRAAGDGPLAEIDVFAVTDEEFRLGDHVYKVGRILGGATYQVLVTAGGGGGPTPPGGKNLLWWLLLLLLIILLLIAGALRRKKTA